jgi:dethiobiotin synthetase
MQLALPARRLPGLFVTGTDTGVGKTVICGAIANWFSRRGYAVGALKPLATGCVRRREGLDLICPVRLVEPLAPAVAAERAGEPIDWEAVGRSIALMSREAEVMVVEGVGGVMVPLDAQHTVLDLAEVLGWPAVVVARAALGTINHTLLTVHALRSRGIPVAGVVINQYPPDRTSVAEETSPRAIERWGRVPVLCIVPQETGVLRPQLTPDIHAAVDPVDWAALAGM